MRIFVVVERERHVPGGLVVGVFSTQEAADKRCARKDTDGKYEYREAEVWELDGEQVL